MEVGEVQSANGVPKLPEPGDVVEVRGSHWAVAEVQTQALPRSPGEEGEARISHVVDLQSLDEDRMGEELSVVWELEVGHTVAPAQGLPEQIAVDGFDDPVKLAGLIDALRWGAVTSADPSKYQAPFWSGVNVEAYQLEPLRRALSSPRANLLLADDVGLGKTIEAGLVMQELFLRHRARTAIVVCPPSLSIKWQDEMREKFGLAFTIVNTKTLADLRRTHGLNANPFQHFPRVIVSMAWLPQPRAQRMLRSLLSAAGQANSAKRYAFDIMVVDEAHHVAPAGGSSVVSGYAVDTQRTIAVRNLAERCEHRLFLSATPHNGYPESFTALLEMIDSRRFARGAKLDREALREVTVRRLKSDLPEKGFKRRNVQALRFDPSESEQEKFEDLNRILVKSAELNGKKRSGDIVALLLKKRFFSSPFSFGKTLQHYLQSRAGGHGLDDYEYDDIFGEGQNDEEEGLFEQDEAERLRESKSSDPLKGATESELTQLADWGLAYENRPDSRLERMLDFLDSICRPSGTWTNERVVVFTEYAHTVDWLQRVLEAHGYGDHLEVIQGATDPEERELIRARFNEDPSRDKVRVLLATDAAGEGIDLQRHCYRLVNFDIPFNPSRLEQRIGRIDRYGQNFAPEVFHFMPRSSSSTFASDTDFLARIADKIANVKVDLGSANQVIGAEIQSQFSATGSRPDSVKDRKGNEEINTALAGGMELDAGLTKLEKGFEERRAALHLDPANLRRVVDTAFVLSNQPQLNRILVDKSGGDVFEVPELAREWDAAVAGLESKLRPEDRRAITFLDAAAREDPDLVYVHLGHPLVQKAQRLLRRSLWNANPELNRVTAIVVDGLPESFVSAVTRMVLVGRGGLRLHEEIFLAGVRLRGRRTMAEEKADVALEQALDSPNLELADAAVRQALVDIWEDPNTPIRKNLEGSIGDRAQRHNQAVAGQLEERKSADVARAREIFAAFRRNLTDSLAGIEAADEEDKQRLFADEAERRQRRNDIAAMEQRLEALDDEEAREVEAINNRYADVKPHWNAAAVVFALTPEDAAEWGGVR